MKIDKDVLKALNEYSEYDLDDEYSTANIVDADDIMADQSLYGAGSFASWFGKDLTGQVYEGSIDCSGQGLTSLEGAPKEVTGDFNCWDNSLTSLQCAPERVGGHFSCSNNDLTTLEDAPKVVSGNFSCDHNKLTTLEGAPKEVKGSFNCRDNRLTSLEGAPQKVGGSFYCAWNNLKILEGAPQMLNGDFDCQWNNLTSLKGAPQEVGGYFDCSRTHGKLTSLEGAPQKVGGDFYCYDNDSLITLEGAPQEVGGDFSCQNCKNLESVVDAPKSLGGKFKCTGCKAKDIIELFKRYGKGKMSAHDDYAGAQSLSVDMSVADYLGEDYSSKTYEGDLRISGRFITDLHGLPKVINGNLELFKLGITTLEGLPEIVNGNLKIYNYENDYTSAIYDFKYLPSKVTGDLIIKNVLTSNGFNGVDTIVQGGVYISNANRQKNESKHRNNEGTYNIDADDIQADLDPNAIQFLPGYSTSFAKHVTRRYHWDDKLDQDFTGKTFAGDLVVSGIDNFIGAPETIEGDLDIRKSDFETFKKAPKHITGTLYLSDTNIKSFSGDLQSVGSLRCSSVNCDTLEDLPQIENDLTIYYCDVQTLKGLPEAIGGNLEITNKTLESLEYMPKSVKGNFILNTKVNSSEINLKDLPDYIGGYIRIKCDHVEQEVMAESKMKIDEDVLKVLNEISDSSIKSVVTTKQAQIDRIPSKLKPES